MSETVGGAEHLEVASRVASAYRVRRGRNHEENLPYGGWIRQGGEAPLPRSSSQESRPSASPTDYARRCPSRPEISKQPSTPPGSPNVVAYAVSPPTLAVDANHHDLFGALDLPIVRVGKGNWP